MSGDHHLSPVKRHPAPNPTRKRAYAGLPGLTLGSALRVVYGSNNVVVEVTDRGGTRAAGQFGNVVDLSRAAFARLEKPDMGSIRVKIIRLR